MKLKNRFTALSVFSLLYASSASASLMSTTYTGEVWGFNGAVGNVIVAFTYDSQSAGLYEASAAISNFGDYQGNDFILGLRLDHSLSFDAETVTGTTTSGLYLYGNFFDWSPASVDFGFDNRSYASGNTYGAPHFEVRMDNNSRYTREINAVPVPAAVWLFGSGLVGLVGLAKRKKA